MQFHLSYFAKNLRTDPVSGDRTVDEVLKLSDISDLSPEPLYEVLKIVQACEEFPLRR